MSTTADLVTALKRELKQAQMTYADLAKAFPLGSEVEVAVLEADASGRRIRLSRKAVAQQREQTELREYAARSDATPSTSLGSLADKLRDVLKGR